MRNVFFFMTLISCGLTEASVAQWYVGADMGGGVGSGVRFDATSTDRPSICDEYINPLYANIPMCSLPPGTDSFYHLIFGSTVGLIGNMQLGYHITPSFWVEAELAYWQAPYVEGDTPKSEFGESFDKLVGEILLAEERLGTFTSLGLLVNAFYGFTDSQRRMTYYVGGGLGLSGSWVDYTSIWGRQQDPDLIETGIGEPNEDQIRENLAGTFSYGTGIFTSVGAPVFQAMVGFDYHFSQTISVGLKGRYSIFTGYSDPHTMVWDPLRSHAPNNRLDGSEPVEGYYETDDFRAFAVGIQVKKRF